MMSSILRWLIFDLSATCHMTSGLAAWSSALETACLSCILTTIVLVFAHAEVLPVEAGLLIGWLVADGSPGVLDGIICCGKGFGAGELLAVGRVAGAPF